MQCDSRVPSSALILPTGFSADRTFSSRSSEASPLSSHEEDLYDLDVNGDGLIEEVNSLPA